MSLNSLCEMAAECERRDIPLSELVIEDQTEQLELSREALFDKMAETLGVMREAVEEGLSKKQVSASGLTQGGGVQILRVYKKQQPAGGRTFQFSYS